MSTPQVGTTLWPRSMYKSTQEVKGSLGVLSALNPGGVAMRFVGVVALVISVMLCGCLSGATTKAILSNDQGDYEAAIAHAREAISSNPGDAEAYFQLGYAYSALDSVSLAYDSFVKSAQLDPSKKEIAENNIQHNYAKHYNKGLTAAKGGEFLTAIEEYKIAARADPRNSGKPYYLMGLAYASLGENDVTYYERAIKAFQRALVNAESEDREKIEEAISIARRAAGHETTAQRADWSTSSPRANDFTYKNVSVKSKNGYVELIGEVTNNTGKDFTIANFVVSLYGENSSLLAVGSISMSNLAHGQTKSFRSIVEADHSKMKEYKIDFENGF